MEELVENLTLPPFAMVIELRANLHNSPTPPLIVTGKSNISKFGLKLCSFEKKQSTTNLRSALGACMIGVRYLRSVTELIYM